MYAPPFDYCITNIQAEPLYLSPTTNTRLILLPLALCLCCPYHIVLHTGISVTPKLPSKKSAAQIRVTHIFLLACKRGDFRYSFPVHLHSFPPYNESIKYRRIRDYPSLQINSTRVTGLTTVILNVSPKS